MIMECAEIDVLPGHQAQFEAAVQAAAPQFRSAKGCHSMALHRVIEKPGTYRLMVEWTSVEAHMVDFRQSPAFQQWRRLASPHFANPPRVDHIEVAGRYF
jgi:quinol monooxygenase YgiN